MVVRFDVLPLYSEILSIKNSPALRAATSVGSILDEEFSPEFTKVRDMCVCYFVGE
jgi:hypothetical protein